jgi:uncharacterized protein with FMN-binding domain
MNVHPPAGRSPGSDPLLDPSTTNGGAERSGRRTHHVPSDAAPRRSGSRPPRRQHAARGARAVALTASVVATGAVAAALAYSEGAWSAGSEVAAESTTATINEPTTDVATSVTSSTSAAPTSSTPETTQPAETPVEVSGFADGEFLGTAEYTEWGDVQVQVTISDGAIVDVEAIQYPTGHKSSDINSQAIPMLEANAVALQDADVDIVSGATYTSHTYADSLQAALDQAAMAVAQEAGTS